MKKIIIIIAALIVLGILLVALAGMFKFNYLANEPGYDADGNKIKVIEIDTPIEVQATEETKPSNDFIGLNLESAQEMAKQKGVSFRAVKKDGQFLPATADWRPGRINATTEGDIVVSYQIEGQETTPPSPEKISYDANSWKTMISDSCTSFFDGCNNCNRAPGSTNAACTRKACAKYEKPTCSS